MAEIGAVLARTAARQGGVVLRSQLLDGGVTEWALRQALRRRSLDRVASGLMVDAGAPRTELQRLWMAHLAAGERSVISHGSAAALRGLDGIRPCDPTVTVPHRLSPRPNSLFVAHRSRHLDAIDITHLDGLPATTAARCIVDLAAEYGRARLGAVLDSAHFGRMARFGDVGEVLVRVGGPGRAGTNLLVDLLDERSDGEALAQSVLERMLGDVLRMAGITEFTRQHPLIGDGNVTGWVDVYIAVARLIVEADGLRWHSRRHAMLRDRDRDLAAAEQGIQTVRLLYEQLRDDPEGCAARLARVVAARVSEAA